MKVILTEKVPALGNIGEVVNVTAGYGRNFLLPRKLAVVANDSNSKELANHQKRLSKKVEEQKNAALTIKKKLDGMVVEFVKKIGTNGKLFGAITTSDIAADLLAKKIEVERRLITLETAVKSLGTYNVRAKLFTGVESLFQVKVVIDPAQAEQLKVEAAAAAKRKKEAAAAAEIAKTEVKVEAKTDSDEPVEDTAEKILGFKSERPRDDKSDKDKKPKKTKRM
jgi:large subunit ribosomal protein L9